MKLTILALMTAWCAVAQTSGTITGTVKDESGAVYHTYSCYDRGNDQLNIHYHYLDLVPKGRDEEGRGPFWVKRRDEYGR